MLSIWRPYADFANESLVVPLAKSARNSVSLCRFYKRLARRSSRKIGKELGRKVSRGEHPLLIAFRRGAEASFLRGDEPFSDLPEAFRWYRFKPLSYPGWLTR
jgi:hypothetical protein